MIHHNHSINNATEMTGGTRIMEKLSLTKSVAVLIIAIASLILLNIQTKITKLRPVNAKTT